MSNNIAKTLDKRQTQYGDYDNQLNCKITILDACKELHEKVHGKPMTTVHLVLITDIVTKLTRVSANMNHVDSWHDLSGYATLAENVVRTHFTPNEDS